MSLDSSPVPSFWLELPEQARRVDQWPIDAHDWRESKLPQLQVLDAVASQPLLYVMRGQYLQRRLLMQFHDDVTKFFERCSLPLPHVAFDATGVCKDCSAPSCPARCQSTAAKLSAYSLSALVAIAVSYGVAPYMLLAVKVRFLIFASPLFA